MISCRHFAALAAGFLACPAGLRRAQAATAATLYKSPDCGCCEDYAQYLREQGFAVTEIASHDLPLMRQEHGIPPALVGCHMTFIGQYVIEGHVPVAAIRKLLAAQPAIKGISLPGMPEGSPGMSGVKAAPFVIYAITTGAPAIFSRE